LGEVLEIAYIKLEQNKTVTKGKQTKNGAPIGTKTRRRDRPTKLTRVQTDQSKEKKEIGIIRGKRSEPGEKMPTSE